MKIDTEELEAALSEVVAMIGWWHADEVLGKMNMGEGFRLADLFEALGEPDTAAHIIRQVWIAEDKDSRDSKPWANGHGSRKAELTDDDEHNEGDEKFFFDPRPGWGFTE